MKVAISLPLDLLEHFDSVAARAGLNRSEFFRAAGVRLAADLEVGELTQAIDAYLDRRSEATAGADDDLIQDVTRHSRARLAATEGEEW
ncbi:ribbon-helix-helix CopG family protein [Salana multivorans]|uniref:Ribbon-helix-helix CopG family protein n=1 Tax=Salana multivorans TaxID=120377 RepID=A0A3N2D0U1_9MICO|nr:ribbon-helix-helix protein, CopG family [Salana multivorans]MBN8882716.1 ribbon-helix-helix protein, CopG family [Salana multivorans]OJX94213.1 MAG: hypothetical protein BGO96_14825 [Micrococcales bacterium 73-15]ROR93386.1 ribbon-helix-helix CopG family protein [Salana multivorans]